MVTTSCRQNSFKTPMCIHASLVSQSLTLGLLGIGHGILTTTHLTGQSIVLFPNS